MKTHTASRPRLVYGLNKRNSNEKDNFECLPFGLVGKLGEVLFSERVRRGAQVKLEHGLASGRLGQRDINALLEAASNGRVQRPRNIRGAQDEYVVIVVVRHALHLHEKLGLDAACTLGLVVVTRRTQRVDLVDEDDAGSVGARQLEQILDELLALAEPLGEQIGRAHRKESGVVGLGGHGFGQVGLAGAGRSVEKNAAPWLALAGEQMRELDGQDDGLFERLFGVLEARHVAPFHVRFLHHNCTFTNKEMIKTKNI